MHELLIATLITQLIQLPLSIKNMDHTQFCSWNIQENRPIKAEDVVVYCQSILQMVDLHYKFCSAIVRDTDATMCEAACLFVSAFA
jgi:hypothetical protein